MVSTTCGTSAPSCSSGSPGWLGTHISQPYAVSWATTPGMVSSWSQTCSGRWAVDRSRKVRMSGIGCRRVTGPGRARPCATGHRGRAATRGGHGPVRANRRGSEDGERGQGRGEGCGLAGGAEHRHRVGADVGDAVLALAGGERQSGVRADPERGEVVVLAGDPGAADLVLAERVLVEAVDVGFAVAGAQHDEVVGAAVDQDRTRYGHGLGAAVDDGQAAYAEPVRAQVAAGGLVPAADLALPLLAGVGQVGGVPVDALDPIDGGGGHHRLRRDAQERLDRALAGVATADDRGPGYAA